MPADPSSTTTPSIGETLAGLMLRSETWMNRRVESLRMSTNGATTLHVSLDYTLPTATIGRSPNRVLLPLGFVRKGALRRVSTRGASGEPLPILDSNENGALSLQMLLFLAAQVMPPQAASSAACHDALHRIVFCNPDSADKPNEADKAVSEFHDWLVKDSEAKEGRERDAFESITSQLARNFLFAVEVETANVGVRSIAKYSYEDDLPDIRKINIPTTIGREAPQFGIAASWHFEVEAPPGIGIRRLLVQELNADGGLGHDWEDRANGRDPLTVAHVACRPDTRFSTAKAEIVLAPQRRGLPRAALWGALLTSLLLVLAMTVHAFPGVFVPPGSAGSSSSPILLAGAALLLSWLSRAPEHVLVARLQWPLRRILVLSSFVLFGMALIFTVPLLRPWSCIAWAVIAAVQAWSLFEAVSLYRSVTRDT